MWGTIGFYIAAGGLAVITAALTMLYKARAFYLHSVVTTGKIVGTEFVDKSVRHFGYAAVIEFALDNKKKKARKDDFTRIRFKSEELKKIEADYRIGAEIPVRYIPQKPEFAKINSFRELWLEPLIGIFGGLIFLAVGLFFLR